MRRLPRFTIPGLMAVVLVASFAFAALRYASPTWAGALYLLTQGLFALAVVGAVCRGPSERAWWLGFALFGLAYYRAQFWYGFGSVKLPTMVLLDLIKPEGARENRGLLVGQFDRNLEYFRLTGHCLWSLLAATLGGILSHALFGGPPGNLPGPDAGRVRPARGAWIRFAAAGVAALVAGTALVVVGMRSDPALWAGAAYLLTWVLLGTAALGFACGRGRGRRRMAWFGAAFFGLGYMVLTRGSDRYEERSYVHLVADEMLDALRPWLPPVVSGYPAETAAMAGENARIRKALDQPVPMTFRDGVSLGDFVDYIRAATQTADGRQIAIYVDPAGLSEAEKSLESKVQIDLEGRPLAATLKLALHQLRMVYYVGDGLLQITAQGNEDIPLAVDYYRLLGHCVLALLAAGLGALLVPLVAAKAADSPSSDQPLSVT